jgi:hypothetical protein
MSNTFFTTEARNNLLFIEQKAISLSHASVVNQIRLSIESVHELLSDMAFSRTTSSHRQSLANPPLLNPTPAVGRDYRSPQRLRDTFRTGRFFSFCHSLSPPRYFSEIFLISLSLFVCVSCLDHREGLPEKAPPVSRLLVRSNLAPP